MADEITQAPTMEMVAAQEQPKKKSTELTPQKIDRYHEITRNLVITDMNSINTYGSELSTIMSQNSEELLKAVRTNNGGEVAKLTTELLGQLELIDIAELTDNGKFKRIMRKIPVLKRLVPSIQQILNKYDSISDTVQKISNQIESVSLVSKRDNAALEVIFQNDVKYIEQIRELIEAAQLKYEEVMNQLYDMQEHISDYETYEVNDVSNFAQALEKKISDMSQVEYAMKMNLMQIRACQQNNNLIANKADTFVSTVLPVWKTQLSISIMLENNKKNSLAVKEMSDTSNKIIEKNAELLKMNSVTVAKEAERGIFDVQSLQRSTDLMIETIREVNSIHDKAFEERKKIASQIIKMENQINDAVNHAIELGNQDTRNYIGESTARTLKELQN